MSKNRSPLLVYWSYISLIIIGIVIGVLIGLSISPVISIVISSVTATAAAIVTAMSGLQKLSDNTDDKQRTNNQWQINPAPFAWLMSGLLVGVMLGMAARNMHLFGSDVSIEVSKWSKTGLTEQQITERVFEARYPQNGQANTQTPPVISGTVLFTVSADKCGELVAKSIDLESEIDDLKEELGGDNQLLDIIATHAENLKVMVQNDICPEK